MANHQLPHDAGDRPEPPVPDSATAAEYANAIYEAGASGDQSSAPEILRVVESMNDDLVRSKACWALGKLRYEPATPFIIKASFSVDRETRRWALWALGEIKSPEAVERLHDAYQAETDPAFRQLIGGAFKKISGRTVRVPSSKVMKRANVPASTDPESARLLEALQEPEIDQEEKVRLREELQGHDPDLFDRYMASVKARKSVARALNSDAVYEDNF